MSVSTQPRRVEMHNFWAARVDAPAVWFNCRGMFPIRDHNPSGRTPYVTYALIVANVGIFLSYWTTLQTDRELLGFYIDYALIPALVSDGQGYGGFLTSMFLHGGWMHLLGNMLFLYIFGDNLEDEMGHGGFALFYLACGLGAGFIHYVSAPGSPVPTVGASGAIAGVMGGYLLLFPKAKVDILIIFIVFFRIFPLPAWIMLGLWFAFQVFGGFGSPSDEGGVAYWAHVGGFVFGLVLTAPIWIRLGATSYWDKTHGHPPHPEVKYTLTRSNVPSVRRK